MTYQQFCEVNVVARHGTRSRYMEGCRCDKCRGDQAAYQREWSAKRVAEGTQQTDGPGPAELAVQAGLAGLPTADSRPELLEAALSLARVLDNPRAVTAKAAAARNLADISDRLHKDSRGKRTRLASVRQMTAS